MLLGSTSYICVFMPHRLGIVHTYVPDSSMMERSWAVPFFSGAPRYDWMT